MQGTAAASVSHAETREKSVIERVKSVILSGEVQPGERVVETTLAARLGVGKTALRAAMFDLERQGFVRRVANKGVYVIEFSFDDIRQIQRVRQELEVLAVELLTRRLDASDIAQVRAALDALKAAAQQGDVEGFYRCDLGFHGTLWRLSRNAYIVRMLESVMVPLFSFYVIKTQLDAQQLLDEYLMHEEVLEAMKTGDIAVSRKAMQEILKYYPTNETVFRASSKELKQSGGMFKRGV
jgi:DNA-binding GntR family transcriptional regulator